MPILVCELFWGLWLLPFGYLVFKSGFLPKVLGILLMMGCLSYLVHFFEGVLFPGLLRGVLKRSSCCPRLLENSAFVCGCRSWAHVTPFLETEPLTKPAACGGPERRIDTVVAPGDEQVDDVRVA